MQAASEPRGAFCAFSVPMHLVSIAMKRRIVWERYPCGSRSAPRNCLRSYRERILPGRNYRCGSRCVPLLVISADSERRIVWEHYPCGSSFAQRDSLRSCRERILVGEHYPCGSSFAPRNGPAGCFGQIPPGRKARCGSIPPHAKLKSPPQSVNMMKDMRA